MASKNKISRCQNVLGIAVWNSYAPLPMINAMKSQNMPETSVALWIFVKGASALCHFKILISSLSRHPPFPRLPVRPNDCFSGSRQKQILAKKIYR